VWVWMIMFSAGRRGQISKGFSEPPNSANQQIARSRTKRLEIVGSCRSAASPAPTDGEPSISHAPRHRLRRRRSRVAGEYACDSEASREGRVAASALDTRTPHRAVAEGARREVSERQSLQGVPALPGALPRENVSSAATRNIIPLCPWSPPPPAPRPCPALRDHVCLLLLASSAGHAFQQT
jgi:hypothetical protein